MEDYADDTASLLEALGWEKSLVIGVSFGGMVAQEFAIKYQEKIIRLALLCTSSGGEGGASYPLHELSDWPVDKRARKMLEISDIRRNKNWQEENIEKFNALLEMNIRQMEFSQNDPELSMGLKRQLEARISHDTYHRLKNLKIPVGIFGGRYDGIAKPENLENLHKQIPNSTLKMFDGGHLFLIQDPKAFPEIIFYLKNE